MDTIRLLDKTLVEYEDKYYDFQNVRQWADQQTYGVLALAVVYVVLAHLGVRLMEKREKFGLRRTVVCWNAGLAWYSMFSVYRFWPGLFEEDSLIENICSMKYMEQSGRVWAFLFLLSKFAELGDTVFVVLKKKKLIFLHWFHHVTVLLFSWFNYLSPGGLGRVFAVVNMVIHTIMYSYYGIVSSGLVRPPRWVNVTITAMQLSQMGIGVVATFWAYHWRISGHYCALTDWQFYCSLALYGSYVLLFGNYFFRTYLQSKPKLAKEAAKNS